MSSTDRAAWALLRSDRPERRSLRYVSGIPVVASQKRREASGRPAGTCNCRFDQPERLIGGDENLVRIVQAERRQVDEQVVPVGERQGDRRQIDARRQR